MLEFNGELYAGTRNMSGNGAHLWKMDATGNWTNVMDDGFGNPYNDRVNDLLEFGGWLYASTWADDVNGGEVWRSDDGAAWERVASAGFGDSTNASILDLVTFGGQIFASTFGDTSPHGAEIWRSSTGNDGSWQQVVSNGFNADAANISVPAMEVFGSYLYAGSWNTDTGAEIWRSDDGSTWDQVNLDGFGEGYDNGFVGSMAVFQSALYAATSNCNTGGQVWRTSNGTDWTKVVDAGFGDINNCSIAGLFVFDNYLYASTHNHPWNYPWTGMEIWRTADGLNWDQVSPDGIGDSNNKAGYFDNAVAVFNNQLFFGTNNLANGGEVWLFQDQSLYLPLVMRP
jgi:hypothetical protein